MGTHELLLTQSTWQRSPPCVDRRVVRSERPRRGKRGKSGNADFGQARFFPSFPLATLGSLVVCGVGVHFVGRACSLRVAVVGALRRQGARKGKGDGEAEREKPTRRARPVGHTRILSSRTPHAMTVRPSFPVFVSCFRFFRRGGMFQDCSVSAAVTHLVSCGGGYAGLPDACMRACVHACLADGGGELAGLSSPAS